MHLRRLQLLEPPPRERSVNLIKLAGVCVAANFVGLDQQMIPLGVHADAVLLQQLIGHCRIARPRERFVVAIERHPLRQSEIPFAQLRRQSCKDFARPNVEHQQVAAERPEFVAQVLQRRQE